jgi:hypothetical protein
MIDDLDPRSLADWIEPELRFDEPAVGDYRLYDIFRHETRNAVCVVLQKDDEVLTIEIAPSREAPSAANAAGLDLSWQNPGPAEAGLAVCQMLAERLSARLGREPRTWRLRPGDADRIPRALSDEIELVPGSFADDADAAALEQDARHYQRLYDAEPLPVRVRCRAGSSVGLSVHYPRPKNRFQPSSAVYPVPLRWVSRRIFRRYLAAFGCAFEHGEARIVPTPATFERARAQLVPDGAPLRIELARGRFQLVLARTWIRRVAFENILPVRVAPDWAVGLYGMIRRAARRSPGPIDVGVLAHDVSLHALAFHAIPRHAWSELTEIAARRLGRHGGAGRLARFFEEDLTRACWSVWRTVERPTDFGSAFEPAFDDLKSALFEI